MRRTHRTARTLLLASLIALAVTPPVFGYAGPGAGFALVTSFLVVVAAVALAGTYLALWPLRLLRRLVLGRCAFAGARARRVVVLGLDGLDPRLTDRFIAEGKLPHLARLHFRRLHTTNPPLSPVAWSTFQTGMDPSYHGLFDFLRPARPSYLAELSSVKITPPPRALRFGKYRLPLGRPRLRLRRHGVPFWKILGRRGIFSAVLRVPITFPPERFRGVGLSAMCVPDLRGTQGSFTLYSSEERAGSASEGGVRIPVTVEDGRVDTELGGPPDPFAAGDVPLRLALRIDLKDDERATLRVGRRRVPLRRGISTDWVRVIFRASLGIKVRGLVRFTLLETAPFRLYASPIQIDPERPALPISHPRAYSVYLAKRHGSYATLGLAEDTWSLNEGVVAGEHFLESVWKIHEERERMFFDAIEKVRQGLVVCVFDASDRVQHMFFRTLEEDGSRDGREDVPRGVIEDLYRRMDDLVGRTLERLGKDDVLLVMSDHGFGPFRRGINLNAWLREEGLLALEEEGSGGSWFDGVDWERTRAYALGLSGIYLNLEGRESRGIVRESEAAELKEDIRRRLEALRDPEHPDGVPVRRAFDAARTYRGPYRDESPDLLVGYGEGYRVSWNGATGHAEGAVFEDNERPWSGDHCVDPELVPGVLFSNRQPATGGEPHLVDLAPTVLDLFGVEPPRSLRGRALFREDGKEVA